VSRISEQVDVDVPVSVAYDQWTRFEAWPRFMDGVERVVQLDPTTLDWTATIAGRTKHWRAQILDQRADELISWRSLEGPRNDGVVRLSSLSGESCRVALELDVEPEGILEATGDALGFLSRRVAGDLERFKELVESRGRSKPGRNGGDTVPRGCDAAARLDPGTGSDGETPSLQQSG
jgi:uncharacterized membrane protein